MNYDFVKRADKEKKTEKIPRPRYFFLPRVPSSLPTENIELGKHYTHTHYTHTIRFFTLSPHLVFTNKLNRSMSNFTDYLHDQRNRRWGLFTLLVCLLAGAGAAFAQGQESFFEPISGAQGRLAASVRAIPNAKLYKIDEAGLRNALANTAKEDERNKPAATIAIPLPDGTTEHFALRETLVMSPEVAAANPTIKTYEGEGTIHKNYIIRMSLSVMGFEALIWGVDKDAVYFARTKDASGETLYQSYFARDARKVSAVNSPMGDHHCATISTSGKPELPGLKIGGNGLRVASGSAGISNGATVRTFRIAIATTGEWSRNAAGVDPDNPTQTPIQIRNSAYAVVITSINRINAIYTRELACRFQNVNPNLTTEQTNIIYDNPNTDPYDNTDNAKAPNNQLAINQATLDNRVGTANYDVGHLFGTGGGGVALSPSLCAAGNKAQGYSARGTDTGDPFVVDYFAHELGHQFAMGHTYNVIDQNGACTTRSAEEAYEVASGSTIMSYVGICNEGRNLQQYNDFALPSFHVSSITKATQYLAQVIEDGCGTTAGANAIPTLSAGSSYTIPRLTPFTLTATGSDADASDAANLLYSWEEFDLAPANGATGFGGTPSNVYDIDDDGVPRPILRAYSPVASAQRTFPSTAFILNPQNNATPGENQPQFFYTGTHPTGAPGATCPTGQTCIIGERLPTIARTMNFRVSVRDRKGGVADAGTVVTVVNTSGAFRLTSFDNASTVAGNSQQTVTWNVVGTDQAPISCANVAIKLSTDGGVTFPITLLANTPNDGTESVTLPDNQTTTARIKVEAVGNIFFDISNANFTITAPAPAAPTVANLSASPNPVCAAQSVTFTATVGNTTGNYSYELNNGAGSSKTGTANGAAFSQSLTAAGTGNQTYTLTITNTDGSANTTTSLTVNGVPTAPMLTASPGTTTTNQPITVTASGCTGTVNWTAGGGTGVSNGDQYTFTAPGSYTLSATCTLNNCPSPASPMLSLTIGGTPPAGNFAIIGVTTVSCTPTPGNANKRDLTFMPLYVGTNGQSISFSIKSETLPTTASGPYTLGVYLDNPTLTLKATQSGTAGEASFSYNWLAVCSTTPPPPPAGDFAITGVTTVSCKPTPGAPNMRDLTFTPQYQGANGQPISFSVKNETLPTTAPGPYSLRVYLDNPTLTLKATQSGTAGEVSFSYNWLAVCGAGNIQAKAARESVAETSLDVRVLGNPVANGQVQVEVGGTGGQPIELMLTDLRGRVINAHRVERPAPVETLTYDIGRQPVGMLLLRVSTSTQAKTVKLLKAE